MSYFCSRQLQYDTAPPPLPRPKSHTVSVPSGNYTSVTEGNRPLAMSGGNRSQDYGNLEDQEWYWGNVSKYVC